MKDRGPYYAGVDLGATKTIVAVFDARLRALATRKAETPSRLGPRELVDFVAELYRSTAAKARAAESEVQALGLAAAAPVDRASGAILDAPNLGWKAAPVADRLAKALGLVVSVENDVQAGVLGELRLGALRGCRNALGVFVGTGIGGGIVVNGELYRGAHGSAGEFGHMVLQDGGAPCGCGNLGCLEALASRNAVAAQAVTAAQAGKSPKLFAKSGSDLGKCKSSVIAASYAAGERFTVRAVDRSAYWLGAGLASLVAALDPEAIVLGGGLPARLGEPYRAAVEASLGAHVMPALAGRARVLLCELGDLSVPAGAALAAVEASAGREAAAAMSVERSPLAGEAASP